MDVTTDTFERDVIERSRELPVVVDFWAAWCWPCRALGRVLEAETEKRRGRLELVKVDVDAEPGLSVRYRIQGIPTVKVFRDGEPVGGFVGAYPRADRQAPRRAGPRRRRRAASGGGGLAMRRATERNRVARAWGTREGGEM